MKDILKIVFVVIGTLIGAGFASGQEMDIFFFKYGIKGIIGIFISTVIIGFTIYKTFKIIYKTKIKTYKDFLDNQMDFKEKNKFLNIKYITNIIINFFILITFFIMIAGFGAYFEQEFQINRMIGSTILAILSFIVFMTSIKGLIKVNEILVPLLILFIIILGVLNIKQIEILYIGNYLIQRDTSNWIISSILYSSYNSILLIPVLITLKEQIKKEKDIFKISSIVTIIVIILSIMVFLLLVRIDVDITKLEMPAVYVIDTFFKQFKIIYGFIILTSIFTTSTSLGTSFLQNTAKNKKSYTQIAIIMCITSVLISGIGFSKLVSLLYPIFGYLGLIQIIRLIF